MNTGAEVRFDLTRYRGKPIISVRVWYPDNGEMRPAKQGINLDATHAPEVAVGAKKLEEALKS